MNKKPDHKKKWMPSMYVAYFGILKDLAKEHGYALCVHGTITRDFDLIAVPFMEKVSPHEDLLKAIRAIVGDNITKEPIFDIVGHEPHGRICYTIECGAGGYFDISFTPSLQQAIEKIKKDAEIKKEISELLNRVNGVQASVARKAK